MRVQTHSQVKVSSVSFATTHILDTDAQNRGPAGTKVRLVEASVLSLFPEHIH